MKLSIKLPLLLLPLTALSLMLVGYVCYVKLRENAEEKTFKQASALVSQVDSYVSSSTATARANVSLFADYPTVKYFLLTEDETERYELMQRPVQMTLRNFQKAYPEYYELRLLLPDGFEDIRLVNRDIDNQTEEEGTTALFRELQSGSDIYQRYAYNPDNDELACFLFKRISLANEYRADFSFLPTLRGYLGITMDTTALGTLLEENPLGDTGGMLLADSDGRPLLVPSHLKWMATNNQLAGLLTGNTSHKQFHPLQLAGQQYYHASQQLTEGMWLHTLVPDKELHDASRRIGRLVAGTTILVLLLSLSIMLYLLRVQVLAPLKRLQQALLRIEEGEDLVQIPITRRDELGELGSGLNRMSHALKKSNDQIREMAFNDSLTLLPNRFMFYKTLKRAMEIALVEDKRIGVLFVDLDNFKQINDTLGHSFGDKLLKEAGMRLKESLRGKDLACPANLKELEHNLSRLGGDEFTVLLSGITSAVGIGKIAERLLCAIKAPFVFDEQEHYITASIGIAVYPEDGTNAEDLVKHSDLAMYQAKKNGKGRYEFYSQEISRQAHSRSRLEQRLRVASAENAFEVFYQPIINTQTQELTSLEALLRWRDSELGNVPPDQFIPIAEDIGLIHPIGEWVLHDVCRQLNEWTSMGLTGLKVAVNVSGKQLENANFVELVLKKLKEFDVSPSALHLELTESAIIDGKVGVYETLETLQKNGIRIALDDFGTGYSSLSYLRKLPINVLKIDRSFIQGLGEQNNNILLSSIITMAQALGLDVVAEGVEEQGQFAFLKKEGCNSLQGYLFSRPVPNLKITEKIQSGELIIAES